MNKFILYSLLAILTGTGIAYMSTLHSGLIEIYWMNWHITIPLWIASILLLTLLSLVFFIYSIIIFFINFFKRISIWKSNLKEKKQNTLIYKGLKMLLLNKARASLNAFESFHSLNTNIEKNYLLLPYLFISNTRKQTKKSTTIENSIVYFLESKLSKEHTGLLLLHLYAYTGNWNLASKMITLYQIKSMKKNNLVNKHLILHHIYQGNPDKVNTIFEKHFNELNEEEKITIFEFFVK